MLLLINHHKLEPEGYDLHFHFLRCRKTGLGTPYFHDLAKLTFVYIHQRSTDRNRMSKRLSEEAERYIEDFISNVEDTDISSLDGERSDTSSSLGGMTKTPTTQRPTMSVPLPVDTDGVLLPWLQWETGNDASPAPCMNKTEPPTTPKTMLFDAAQVD